MDSTGGQSSMRKATEERSEMVWRRSERLPNAEERREIQRQHRLSLLSIKEKFAKEASVLLPRMPYMPRKFSMQKEFDESGFLFLGSEMERRRAEEHMFLSSPPEHRDKLMQRYYLIKYEKEKRKAWVAEQEKRKAFLASKEKAVRRAKAKAKATAKAADMKIVAALKLAKGKYKNKNKKNQKRQHEGRPLESVTKAGKATAEINLEGSSSFIQKEAENEMMEISPEMLFHVDEDFLANEIQRASFDIQKKLAKKKNKKMYEEVLLILLRFMPYRLEQGRYDEKNEIDRGKSTVEACLDTNEGTHTTMVEPDFEPAADPSATNSGNHWDTMLLLLLLLKGMSNQLDKGSYDENNEIDRGKSAIEEEHMPIDGKNPSDRGEESVMLGSSKSIMDQEVISQETEDSMTKAKEAVKEVEEDVVLVRMDSSGRIREDLRCSRMPKGKDLGKISEMPQDVDEPMGPVVFMGSCDSPEYWDQLMEHHQAPVTEGKISEMPQDVEEPTEPVVFMGNRASPEYPDQLMEHHQAPVTEGKIPEMPQDVEEPTEPVAFMGNCDSPEYRDQLMEHHQAPVTEAWGSEEPGTEMDEVGRSKLAIEEHLPMVGFEFKSGMEIEAGKAEEGAADMNSEGLIQEEAENELENRLERVGIRPEMQLHAVEDYFPKGVQRALLDIQEKFAKKKTLQQLVKDLSDKFDKSMSTSAIEDHTPMIESEKLLLEPADPSATSSLTRLGIQDDLDHERGKSSVTPLDKKMVDEEMASEAEDFDQYRRSWTTFYGDMCGSFDHMTVLSSMQFTDYTPGRLTPDIVVSTPATLQIYSIKLAEVAGGLRWPLSLYGVVAVRDAVDHNRNILFSCDRDGSQELTQNDPFLRLIGPSRAILFTEEVHIEVELKVKGATAYQDKALISTGRYYDGAFGDGLDTVCYKNCFCKIELCVQTVRKTVQATILGVQIAIGEPYPFKYGARVTCSPVRGKWNYTDNTHVTYPASGEIVMVDSKDGAMLKGSDGYIHLPRNVISVELKGRLDVDIQSYSKSGEIAAKERVSFLPRYSKISRETCCLGGVMMAVTVAWSQVVIDKYDLMVLGSMV